MRRDFGYSREGGGFSIRVDSMTARPGLRERFQKGVGRKDANPFEGIEGEEVSITGNNMRGLTAYSKFQDFVVLRVATSVDSHIHIHPLSFTSERCQKITNIFFVYIFTEPLSAEHFIEFSKSRKGKQHPAFLQSESKGLTWFGNRQE